MFITGLIMYLDRLDDKGLIDIQRNKGVLIKVYLFFPNMFEKLRIQCATQVVLYSKSQSYKKKIQHKLDSIMLYYCVWFVC